MKRSRSALAGIGLALVAAIGTIQSPSIAAPQAVPVQSAAQSAARNAGSFDAPDIPTANVMAHVQEFQRIATANGGNRAHGRPGFKASADYVKAKLDEAGYVTTLQPFTHNGATGYNVIAEWPHGDADNVIMAGAHLDGVPAGPGINDNASGSSAVLEVALAVARADARPTKRLRFGWWGAEELGLIGSKYYAKNLGDTGRAKLDAYLNFDMVGAKGITTWGVYNQNAAIANTFKEYFAAKSIGTYNIAWNGSSDHSAFTPYNIPVGGIGSSDDACYHSACDTIANVEGRVMGHSTNAIAHTVWKLAQITTTVNDFALSLSATGGATIPGEAATSTVSVRQVSGSAQDVRLTASAPAGVDVTFNPATVRTGGTSTMAAKSAVEGRHTITVTGTGADGTVRTTPYVLTVQSDAPAQFTMSLEPAEGSVAPGMSITTSVRTQNVSAKTQQVRLQASGLPTGATATFNPTTVTSGGSSQLTIATTASTPVGTYDVTVTGTGETNTQSKTYALTVAADQSSCDSKESRYKGSLSSGGTAYQPNNSYFLTNASGLHEACLDGPAGADFDLYLQYWSGSRWTTVARGATASADENISYSGNAGYYRYQITAYSGSGAYTLGYNAP